MVITYVAFVEDSSSGMITSTDLTDSTHPRERRKKKMATEEEMKKISIECENSVMVFLDGEIIGAIVEAHAEWGELKHKTQDGSIVTRRGEIHIFYNGHSCTDMVLDYSRIQK